MEEKNLEKLFNKKYSVKQMVSYFIITYQNTENKLNFNEIMNNLIMKMIKVEEKKVLDMVDIKIIFDIDVYWKVTTNQIISYAYIIFNNLISNKPKNTITDIIKEFKSVYKIYSPSNAEEFVKNKINENETNLYIKTLFIH